MAEASRESAPAADRGPGLDPYAGVVGQAAAVDLLRRTAPDPLPAYLFVGPRGSGRMAAALAFGADVLSHSGDVADVARHGRLALAGRHPDLVVVERAGPFIAVEQAELIIRESALAPVEAGRRVFVLADFELVRDVGPKLLKTIEEPPRRTIFVVIASEVPAELVTIASRCVPVRFDRLADDEVIGALVADGTDPDAARTIAEAVNGDLGRARLLAVDGEFSARRQGWWAAVDSLDGSGRAVALTSLELLAAVDTAAAPLRARHESEAAQLSSDEELYGVQRGAATRMAERHKRELRRHRTDELRMGLQTLAARLRADVLAGRRDGPATLPALTAIDQAGEALVFNANERLLLQWVLLCCSPAAATGGPGGVAA